MSDYIVRASAADAQVRAFAATTAELVETARARHDTSPAVTAALGRLLTAGVMMGSMLKGDKDLLTLQVEGNGPMRGMIVTADAGGRVKGYAYHPQAMAGANEKGKLDVAGVVGKGFLKVIKDMGLKEPYAGQTALQTGEIAEDLTYYFAASEQTPSSVGLGVLMEKDNTVRRAGGFIIQLMPFAAEETVVRLEENLRSVASVTSLLDAGKTPEELLNILLGNIGLEILDTTPARFYCNCDKRRVEKAVASIGKKELEEMIEEGKDVEVNCHFCNTNYSFTPKELREIRRYV